jgi:hypothetical protein
MPDTLIKRLRQQAYDKAASGLDNALYVEAADALSAATERERGLREALNWIADEGLSCGDYAACVREARAALEHKGTPRG